MRNVDNVGNGPYIENAIDAPKVVIWLETVDLKINLWIILILVSSSSYSASYFTCCFSTPFLAWVFNQSRYQIQLNSFFDETFYSWFCLLF
jgi:hypothetical protein